jgi:two-component system cell cycle sensor histidine kinase/response regulator CckA
VSGVAQPASAVLKELFDKAPLPYQSLDAEGRFLMVNQAWLDLLGYEEGEVVGRHISEFLTPASIELVAERFPVLKRTGRMHRADFELVRKDGTVIDIELNGSIATDADGSFLRTHCIFMDVSARQFALRRLQESERQYRTLVEMAQEGFWQLDRDGRTVYVNQALTRILGYAAAEMVGRLFFEFTDEAGADMARRILAVREHGSAELYDFEFLARDGRRVHTAVTIRPLLDDDGAYAGAIAGVIDMTERRQFEARLLHAQKLESLAVMAGGIAHDFNNLLQTILGNADLALLYGPQDPQPEGELRAIESAARQAAGLCRQMLAYAGRGDYTMQPVRLDELISELAMLLRATINRKVELRYEFASGLPEIHADAAQLRQAMVNLVTNAAEAIDDKPGTVRMTVASRELYAEEIEHLFPGQPLEPGTFVVFSVSDTGCGIPAELTDLIFDPFFTTKFAGRGLGLAVVRGVALAHGGTVNVASTPGAGTTVEVWLPAVARSVRDRVPARLPCMAAEPDPTPGGRRRALVAEDETDLRTLVTKMFASLGWEAVAVPDGAQACEAIAADPGRYDLVVLDWSMPVMDGREALVRIRETAPALPVFLTSGHDRERLSEGFGEAAPAGFLAKPYSLLELRRALARLDQAGA